MSKSPALVFKFKTGYKRADLVQQRTQLFQPAVQTLNDLNPQLQKELADALGNAAEDVIYDRIKRDIKPIQDAVRESIRGFATRVVRFFFNINSPITRAYRDNPSGRRRAIRRPPQNTNVAIRFKESDVHESLGFTSKATPGPINDGFTVNWAALSPETLRKKTGRHFFVDEGKLYNQLLYTLGRGFEAMLNFQVRVNRSNSRAGRRESEIVFTALPEKGMGPALTAVGLAALSGDPIGSTRNNRQILRFMQIASGNATDELLTKLANGGKNSDKPERPFLQPAFGFYLLNKFPYVVENAVRRAANAA